MRYIIAILFCAMAWGQTSEHSLIYNNENNQITITSRNTITPSPETYQVVGVVGSFLGDIYRDDIVGDFLGSLHVRVEDFNYGHIRLFNSDIDGGGRRESTLDLTALIADNFTIQISFLEGQLHRSFTGSISQLSRGVSFRGLPFGRYRVTVRHNSSSLPESVSINLNTTRDVTLNDENISYSFSINESGIEHSVGIMTIDSEDLDEAAIYWNLRRACGNCHTIIPISNSEGNILRYSEELGLWYYIYRGAWWWHPGNIEHYQIRLGVRGPVPSARTGIRVPHNGDGITLPPIQIGEHIHFTYDYTWYDTYPSLESMGWVSDRLVRSYYND